MALLSRDDVSGLLQALSDPAPVVRSAALRALVNLPLQRNAWWAVADRVNGLLDQTPEGDSFDRQTLGGIPYGEAIQAAVHIPSTNVRRRLYSLLDSPDADLRYSVMIALAGDWDTRSIPALLQFLQASRPLRLIWKTQPDEGFRAGEDLRRNEAARLLSILDLSGFKEQALTLCKQEPDPEVRFWLALALAGTGQTDEFKAALRDLQAGKFDLSEFYGMPTLLHTELTRRRAFRGDLTGLISLLRAAVRKKQFNYAESVASDLLYGLELGGEGEKPSPSGGDPEQAARLAEDLEKNSPYDRESPSLSDEEIQQLRPLDAASAAKLVSTLFRNMADRSPDIMFDNELVRLIYQFDAPFQPNIPALFASYRRVFQDLQLLAWQIAWTVSRAGPEALVSGLNPYLQAPDETGRLAAARLIEEAARYLNQDFPPMFGGGEPPPETLSIEMDWIDMARMEPPVVSDTMAKPPAPRRYVNVWFTRKRKDETRLDPLFTLVQNQAVYLRINIGPYHTQTILAEARPFPSQEEIEQAFPEVKDQPIPLEVAIFSNDFRLPAEPIEPLTLLRGQPTETRYFRVVPLKPGPARLRVCVFYRNHLLQSLGVSAFVSVQSETAPEPQRASVEMTFSADFTRVHELPARGLWLGLNQSADGTHTVNLKGGPSAVSRNLEKKIEEALAQARDALNEVSFSISIEIVKDEDGKEVIDKKTGLPERKGKKDYRFRDDNSPKGSDPVKRFKEDLTKLADVGRRLYDAVFGTGAVPTAEERATVQPRVDNLLKALRDEQVIQIARLKDLADIWPWALMYDLSIEPDHVTDVCLAFHGDNGRALPYAEGVKRCKHRDPRTGRHTNKRVVCPYGFWGFKHIIEQPTQPGGEQAFTELIREVKVGAQPVLTMPLAEELNRIEPDHIEKMKALKFDLLNSLSEVTSALDPNLIPPPPEPHAMYFFCHGKYDSRKNPYLQVGKDESLLPSELDELRFRWNQSHGLVFINGCHTVDLAPKDLSTIMAPFVKAYASGIIGTEITVHTFLAREIAQKFFERLLPDGSEGQKVGQILKDIRLELLMKYNPLGLVYTPYCSADLHLVR